MTSHLIPTIITDVNGVTKVVHRSPRKMSAAAQRSGLRVQNVAIMPRSSDIASEMMTVRDISGREWDVAPDQYTGARCYRCRSWLPDTLDFHALEEYRCDECGTLRFAGEPSGIRLDAVRFFDENEVRAADWFHVSTKPDWFESINAYDSADKPFVHVGSHTASVSRLLTLVAVKKDESVPLFMYRLRVKPDVPIAPSVYNDDDADAPATIREAHARIAAMEQAPDEMHTIYAVDGINRYVNRFEDPGSVSLMLTGDMFEMLEVVPTSYADFAHWKEG
jgi:hypothetical protein